MCVGGGADSPESLRSMKDEGQRRGLCVCVCVLVCVCVTRNPLFRETMERSTGLGEFTVNQSNVVLYSPLVDTSGNNHITFQETHLFCEKRFPLSTWAARWRSG